MKKGTIFLFIILAIACIILTASVFNVLLFDNSIELSHKLIVGSFTVAFESFILVIIYQGIDD